MSKLIEMGVLIEARPWDDICCAMSALVSVTIVDRAPFFFLVEELLTDDRKIFGVGGRVVSRPGRYDGLFCNAIIRVDDPEWTERSSSIALLKVGPGRVHRVPGLDARHPDGTRIDTYPRYVTGGEVVAHEDEIKGGGDGLSFGQ